MLTDDIREVGHEPVVLAPTEAGRDLSANTWWLSVPAEERSRLDIAEVIEALHECVAAIRAQIGRSCFVGSARFYLWHDRQAGQLRCSTTSSVRLPFRSEIAVVVDPVGVVREFLLDPDPGVVSWGDVDREEWSADREPDPLSVWVVDVGNPMRVPKN